MQRCSHCGHYGDRKTHCRRQHGFCAYKRRRPLPNNKRQNQQQGYDQRPKLSTESIYLDEYENYEYKDFEDQASFRVLVLHPGDPDDLVQCSLEIQPIHGYPPYQAISYTWGESNDRADILCEGKRLNVPRNLMHALQKFRRRKRPRILWADAVCIDQNDMRERGHQVQMMARIFKQAQTVLVWLGQDEGINTVTLFKTIRKTFAALRSIDDTAAQEDILRKLPNVFWQDLVWLAQKPWFKRLWIIQEIGLAAHGTIHCGAADLAWAPLWRFCILMRNFLKLVNEHGLWDIVQIWDLGNTTFRNGTKHPENALNVLRNGQSHQCSDPKDRVYAFLGHPCFEHTLANRSSSSFLLVDYTISHQELYLDVAQRLIQSSNRNPLDLLQYIVHEQDVFHKSLNPSWVPQWDTPFNSVLLGGVGWRLWRAHAQTLADFRLADRALSLTGFGFDKIIWRSDTFYSGSIPPDPAHALMKQNPHPLSQIWGYLGTYMLSESTAKAVSCALCARRIGYHLALDGSSANIAMVEEKFSLSFFTYSFEMGIITSRFGLYRARKALGNSQIGLGVFINACLLQSGDG
ncbi:heterokaryon incompatibility [Diplodia corticola]|uniref:Heterokaryon incompatibility n=1 Tax=Diplodia corticola TaxID=236234 RepID=A0A1J9SEJ9_9PEZI|nr:heterokaryon incompatibility [Diplodia corticola]OJD38005.1 heterokaryon incompatibility [Diplodia corticola]